MEGVFFDHATINAWIAEDTPLLDLVTAACTTHRPPTWGCASNPWTTLAPLS